MRISLNSRLLKPLKCLGGVWRHVLAIQIHEAESALSLGVSMRGGFLKPFDCLCLILRGHFGFLTLGSG